MTKHILLFLILPAFTVSIGAQKPSITLEEAVLYGYSRLAPERLNNALWIPGDASISYVSPEGDKLMRRAVRQDAVGVMLSLEKLNAAFQLSLRSFPQISWIDGTQFTFRSGSAYYLWDTAEETGKKIAELPAESANVDVKMPGGLLAFTNENNLNVTKAGAGLMKVTDHQNNHIVSGQAIARYEFGISKGIFWSPDGANIAFYEKDESAVTDYPIVDISTTPAMVKNIKYPMAGQSSEHAKVGIYNLMKKKTIYLDVPGPADQYLTNLSWDPSGEYVYISIVNREQNHLWLQQYEVKKGKLVRTILEETHPKYVEPEHPVWFIPGKANEFLWFSERDGFNHLYRYNTAGDLLGQVTSGNWVVENILGLDETGESVLVSGWDEGGMNKLLWSASLESGESRKIIDEEGIHQVSLSTDGRYLLDQHTSITVPYKAIFRDLQGKIIAVIQESTDPLADYEIGQTELLKIPADDGTILNARLIKPSNFDSQKKYPVIVYVYGGPHLQLINNNRLANAPLWMHYAANQGYLVFSIDNRGSANRGLAFENVIHRQLGETEMADQLEGVAWLQQQPWVDTSRMAVHGWSFGGFMTTSLMLRHPGTFQVGVAGGPVTDWKYYEVMYGERYMDTPEENPEGYKRSSLLQYTPQLSGDLLLIHGYIDDVVVLQHNLALLREFVKNGKQVDFFVYPSHPHNVRGRDRVHLMEKVLNYITEKLD